MMRGNGRVLQLGALPDHAIAELETRFELVAFADEGAAISAIPRLADVQGMATSGKATISAALLECLPELKIISCLGAGTEAIDTEAARERAVELRTTSHVLASDVADIAMGLIIATARDLFGADQFVRSGGWTLGKYPLARSLKGARLGIVGLGAIGSALAGRAEAFGMAIGYHTRRVVSRSPHPHFESLPDLAAWCDFLALCCPGSPATYRLADAQVLGALGAKGFLINVARGSVVDEAALAEALQAGVIAGAGLDVFEDEPHPHPALLGCPKTVLLPHIGSATTETRDAMARAMVDALVERLRGDA
ncbi:MAG: D-isomer specific 2-hydroxyacid dehydrogenase, NAD-binding protein [Xanthobacteraceae bacterium]|jgi:lactate dehydrogenase-like 2-hydroxyacid dehydrogenase|nr:D-isomer specific 2-hydroxyacid dehydrogenase, NAD-binding protein [Xanthobacteraceae bacterium]